MNLVPHSYEIGRVCAGDITMHQFLRLVINGIILVSIIYCPLLEAQSDPAVSWDSSGSTCEVEGTVFNWGLSLEKTGLKLNYTLPHWADSEHNFKSECVTRLRLYIPQGQCFHTSNFYFTLATQDQDLEDKDQIQVRGDFSLRLPNGRQMNTTNEAVFDSQSLKKEVGHYLRPQIRPDSRRPLNIYLEIVHSINLTNSDDSNVMGKAAPRWIKIHMGSLRSCNR